ncbi:MAG: TIGR00725 family protein [Deltaproteobacteria bacterium]|nr:TIGR00725 family protein [Deltaproteobacteria bacterium]
MARKLQIAVVGDNNPSPEVTQLAEEIGQALAQREAIVVCGGLGGVMAGVARGAAAQGGTTIGILPSYDATTGNSSLSIVIPSGLGHARNMLVVASGDAVIALPGSYGTLSEVALALKLGKPVIGVNAWGDVKGVQAAKTADEAVTLALAAAHRING